MTTQQVFSQAQAFILKYASGTTSAVLPSEAGQGNLLIGKYIASSGTATLPTGWINVQNGTVNTHPVGMAYKYANAGDTTFAPTGLTDVTTFIEEWAGFTSTSIVSALNNSASTHHPLSQLTPTTGLKGLLSGLTATSGSNQNSVVDAGYKQTSYVIGTNAGWELLGLYQLVNSTTGTYTVGSTYTSTNRFEIGISAFFQAIVPGAYGQAQTFIYGQFFQGAQAQACIKGNVFAQAQAKINAFGVKGYGQAQAEVRGIWVVQTGAVGNSGSGTPSISFNSTRTGSLLLIFVTVRSGVASGATFPAGWNDWPYQNNSSANSGAALGWKISTGGETGAALGTAAQAVFYEVWGFTNPFPILWAGSEFSNTPTSFVPALTVPDGTVGAFITTDLAQQPAEPNPGPRTLTGYIAGPDTGFAGTGNRHRNSSFYRIENSPSGSTYGGINFSSSGANDTGAVLHLVFAEGVFREFAQAQAWILPQNGFGQAQTYILQDKIFGQAQARIFNFTSELGTTNSSGTNIIPAIGWSSFASGLTTFAQAQAQIGGFQFANAQTFIKGLAFDASTTSGATSFTHTPVGIPRGVVILATGPNSGGSLSSVTYGGVSLTKVRHDELASSAQSQSEIWFVGSNIPTGPQTVSLTYGGFSEVTVVTLTSDNKDIKVRDSGGGNSAGGAGDVSVTLSYLNLLSLATIAGAPHNSGSALTGETQLAAGGHFNGNYWHGYQTTPSQADFAAGLNVGGSVYAFTVAAFTQAEFSRLPTYAQAQAKIKAFGHCEFGQAQAYIGHFQTGQAQAQILGIVPVSAQAQARLIAFDVNRFGQAQAVIKGGLAFAQAMADIRTTNTVYGQAQAYIGHFQSGNAQADIKTVNRGLGQAQAYVGHFQFGQANVKIRSFDQPHFGQAQALIYHSIGLAQAQADIKQIYFAIAQVQGWILPITGKGQAATWVKQTYPLMSLDVNYALLSLGANASDSTGQLTTPDYTIDGEDYGTVWVMGTSLGQTLNIDLGQTRTINYYRILPVTYDCTVTLQYSTNNSTWFTAASLPQFNVGVFDDIDTSRVVTGEITPISARWWRLLVVDGGSYNSTAIATVELGWATVKSGTFAQAAALLGRFGVAQAQAYISPGFGITFGQAKTDIVTTFQIYAQAQTFIIPPTVTGLSLADILQTYGAFAQVPSWVIPPTVIAQALATIKAYDVEGLGQATADIHQIYSRVANAKAFITKTQGLGLALADIKTSRNWQRAQARALIGHIYQGQAQAFIVIIHTYNFAQSKTTIKVADTKSGQALASITKPLGHAYVLADIKQTYRTYGLALALIDDRFALAQANADITTQYMKSAQASVHIHNIATNYSNPYAQSQAMIHIRHYDQAQAQAWIHVRHNPTANAMAFINNFRIAQAQARMLAFNVPKTGQAVGYILAQAITPPNGPSSEYHTYLVRFNNYDLPGYAQDESYDSNMNIVSLYSYLMNGGESEYTGLTNKTITITMKTWEPTYLECKNKVEKAATMLRSSRGFARLYIQRYDSYFLALVKSVEVQKAVKESMRTLDYSVTFEVLPWRISNDE